MPLAVEAPRGKAEIRSGHLQLGGRDLQGNTISLTNYYLERNGQPFLPIMGEFHYSRFPRPFWDEELAKMRAGGVDIVATYVLWNHHEEDEGIFDWAGDRDLRAFVQLCARNGLQAIVRLGPFSHGECRNGGIPDWLYGRPFPVRSTDKRFLFYVRRLYAAISTQIAELLFKDGGPVIGVQLDNEYMHAGAPWEVTAHLGTEWVPGGNEGVAYMRALKDLAIEVGLEVPLYTCTAWVRSPVIENELLPTQGGYAFTPWIPDPTYQQPPTGEFLFRDRHADPLTSGEPSYTPQDYPYGTSELGSGIQITYHHRPIVPPECAEAMAVVALGGGANLLGYYMYHGGSNPIGRHSYLNENSVPRISYDFQAPVREYGQLADSYRSLRLLNLFAQSFGHLLAPAQVVLPAGANLVAPEDTTTVRWAARLDEGSGFLFMTNYQDHVERHDQSGIRLQVKSGTETIELPREGGMVLQKDASAILPINLTLQGIRLVYATTQLLTSLDSSTYIFFALPGVSAEYAFDRATVRDVAVSGGTISEEGDRAYVVVEPGTACVITLLPETGETVRIITLTRAQALQCWRHEIWGQARLILSEATVLPEADRLRVSSTSQGATDLSVFPAPPGGLRLEGAQVNQVRDGLFTRYAIPLPSIQVPLQVARIDESWATVRCPAEVLSQVKDIFLRINYVGDIGEAYICGKLVADNYYNGTTWEIGLKRFAPALANEELVLHVTPKSHGNTLRFVPTGMAVRAEVAEHELAGIDAVSAVPECEVIVSLAAGS